MGVSKNRGTAKWMVKIRENPIKRDDLGGKPIIFGNTHIYIYIYVVSLGIELQLVLQLKRAVHPEFWKFW